jgi:hypothetical protein
MNESFGPWSTAINAGSDLQLSTFWIRRMTMLPALNQTASRASRRALMLLAVAAAATLALPTLKWAPAPKPAAADDKGSAAQNEKNDKGSSAAQSEKKSAEPATAPRTPPMVEYLPRPSKDEQKILASLSKPTTVEFVDLPLEDCITFLAVYHDLNVWLDKGTLADEGVALDQPITLKLAGVSFRSVLNLVLQPLQLTYVVEDDVMKITTAAKAAEKLITRTYPVGDLYQGRVTADETVPAEKAAPKDRPTVLRPGDLEKAIMKTVEPDSWDDTKKNPASITYVKESGSLVIRQSWGAHTKILDLLRDLREAKGKTDGDRP